MTQQQLNELILSDSEITHLQTLKVRIITNQPIRGMIKDGKFSFLSISTKNQQLIEKIDKQIDIRMNQLMNNYLKDRNNVQAE